MGNKVYKKNILNTTTELVEKMDSFLDENKEVHDLLELCLLWALESISGSFLDTNLNCLEQNLSRTSDAMRFVDALKVGLGDDLTELALGPPVWKVWATRSYKRFNEAAKEGGWDIRIKRQLAKSPDLNILDLGFFNSFQSLQYQHAPPKNEVELAKVTEEAFYVQDRIILDNVFYSL